MTKTRSFTGVVVALLLSWNGVANANVVTEWNALAAQCISRPGATAILDLAIVQAAVHDAAQAIEHHYEPYLATPTATGDESLAAAVAAAAYHVLNVLCPASATTLLAAYQPYLDGGDPGLAVGQAAADRLLLERRPAPVITEIEPFKGGDAPNEPGDEPGEWRPTPPGNSAMTFVYLAFTDPFTMTEPSQFRPGPPPALDSPAYLRDYNEVKELGAIESHPATPSCPAPRKTDGARFWSGNFIPQWNDAVRNIAIDAQLSIGDSARLLALVNLAGADAVIAAWDSKLYYNYWRPLTAIREGDDDTNDGTQGDADWTPFINSTTHFPLTPPSQNPAYPDYVSGANSLTGAVIATLQLYFRTDWFKFEVNKATSPLVAICTNPRSFHRFSDAAQEVVEARIWLGIHFRTADEVARRVGTRVAFRAFTNYLRPVHDED